MSESRRLAARLAPAALLVLLGAVALVPPAGGLAFASPDRTAADRWTDRLDELPEDGIVLIAFDPDLGTYPEIRRTVRATLADLIDRSARLAFVSLTPEGRALFLAERARLARSEANPTRLADLGFLPGSEAGIVSIARELPPAAEDGVLPRALADEGIDAVAALLIVGGNDIGPRSWVEQFVPRVGDLPVLAVTPTALLPETQPFLATGQVDALLGTVRDGAAYRADVELDRAARFAEPGTESPAAVLAGLLVTTVVLLHGWASRASAGLRDAARDGRERG